MTGQVLDYSIQANEGVISGDDHQRYRFAGSDWPGAAVPVRGTLVDFDIADGNRAVSIYLVEPIAPPAVPQQSAPIQQPSTATAPPGDPKQRSTAMMLALFGFGVHKFYLGESGGVLRIVLFCTMIGAPIAGLLNLLDTIKFLQMSDAEFDRRYNGGV